MRIFIWFIFLIIVSVPFMSYTVFIAYYRTINNAEVNFLDGFIATIIFFAFIYLGLKIKNSLWKT